jgi:hypothetical protein
MKNEKKNKETACKLKIIDDFCRHLEKGYSEYSFADYNFREVEEIAKEIDEKNMNNIQVEKIKKSIRKSFLYWEKIAFEIYENESKKHFFPLWIFYMKSRFQFGVSEYKKPNEKKKSIEVNLCLDNEVGEIEK